jgi:hypothetical protein
MQPHSITWVSWVPILFVQLILDGLVFILYYYFVIRIGVRYLGSPKVPNLTANIFVISVLSIIFSFCFAMVGMEKWLLAVGVSHDTAVNYTFTNGTIGIGIPLLVGLSRLWRLGHPKK